MTIEKAELLKTKGNAFFKDGKMKEAADCYTKAAKEAPKDPVYPSNLSAALYESGDYAGCVKAISRSWKLLDDNPTLSFKLSTRLAKSLAQGVREGSITLAFITAHAKVISDLEKITQKYPDMTPDTLQDHNRLWGEWSSISVERGDRLGAAREALGRLSRLPVFRYSPEPDLTYNKFGADEVISLFHGWGPANGDDGKFPLDMKSLSDGELSRVSFLFGGVGDARHAFGTIIGAHKAYKTLEKRRRSLFKVHLTMLDFHPNVLARDLCILLFLDALMSKKTPETERLEIRTTLFYMYVGAVMPGYCWERLHNMMKELKRRLQATPVLLPDWIYVDYNSAANITVGLDFWLNLVGKRDTASMLQVHTVESPGKQWSSRELMDNPSISPEYRKMLRDGEDHRARIAAAEFDNLTETQRREYGIIDPNHNGETVQEAQKYLPQRRKAFMDMRIKERLDGNVPGQMVREQDWYESVKAFVPPPELWSRHPGFARFSDYKSDRTELTQKEKQADLRNTTQKLGALPYPDLSIDIFKPPRQIEIFNHTIGLSRRDPTSVPDAPAFSHVSTFFDNVVETLKNMKGRIQLEVVHGELIAELSKWRFGGDSGRPAQFPSKFTRAWLSNCPDYTHGLMNTCIYISPCIQFGRSCAAASNCLFNPGIFKDDEEFCHTYTLLTSRDIPRYFGCKLIRKDALMGFLVVTPQPFPRPSSELASRIELRTWITRVLFCTIIPGVPGLTPYRARMPNNLVAFFGLLVHLKETGFPAHWLSDFLHSVISDNLTSDIAPYTGQWPIPVSEFDRRVKMRKVRLDPWQAELEAILATTRHGIPFAITLPPNFAQSHEEIGLFEANVKADLAASPFGVISIDPAVSLLLYKPGRSVKTLLSSVTAIFEGSKSTAPGTFFIISAVEAYDKNGIIRWRLSRERAKGMKADNWYMVAYRSDRKEPVTQPSPASQWIDIGPDVTQPAMPVL
ncbi:hypothetical protein HWV62_5363 [Athelia sp. TMB]|nr:hypothetical protein HWV62_5363 [Athelia sp. TMB]